MAQALAPSNRQETKPSQRYRHPTDALTVPVSVDVQTYHVSHVHALCKEFGVPPSHLADTLQEWWGGPLGTWINAGMHDCWSFNGAGLSVESGTPNIIKVKDEHTMQRIASSCVHNITPAAFYDYCYGDEECVDNEDVPNWDNIPKWQYAQHVGSSGYGWGLVIVETEELPIFGDYINGHSMYGHFIQSIYEDAMGADDMIVWACDGVKVSTLKYIRSEIKRLERIINENNS
ncbi:MAG: hypothetical protein Unbinned3806contig1000_66 [Prokaryotic dsDNA virus sp.]|nr:MAG: hypothetical protein Unbinned3806contig1000_66 [Prokaryotic dsDNA virus sp.]|tara:strand:+ start:10317 stop:11012 length:696 start_codon:yes stop_codon:yes gene_type:complete